MASKGGGESKSREETSRQPDKSVWYAEGAGKYAEKFRPSNYMWTGPVGFDSDDESKENIVKNAGTHSTDFNSSQAPYSNWRDTFPLEGYYSLYDTDSATPNPTPQQRARFVRLYSTFSVEGDHDDYSQQLTFKDHIGNEFRIWYNNDVEEPADVIADNPGRYDIRYPVNWFMVPDRAAASVQFQRRYPGVTLDDERFDNFEERFRKIQGLAHGPIYINKSFFTAREHRGIYNYSNSKFTELNLNNSVWQACTLKNVDFSDSGLINADFTESILTNANFSGTDLENANFTKTILAGANFEGANLQNTKFTGVDVKLIGNLNNVENPPAVIKQELAHREKRNVEGLDKFLSKLEKSQGIRHIPRELLPETLGWAGSDLPGLSSLQRYDTRRDILHQRAEDLKQVKHHVARLKAVKKSGGMVIRGSGVNQLDPKGPYANIRQGINRATRAAPYFFTYTGDVYKWTKGKSYQKIPNITREVRIDASDSRIVGGHVKVNVKGKRHSFRSPKRKKKMTVRSGRREDFSAKFFKKYKKKFLMFSISFCYWCTEAKKLLKKRKFSVDVVNLMGNRYMAKKIKKLTGHETVPIIFDMRGPKPRFIGGFTELKKYLKKKKSSSRKKSRRDRSRKR